MKKLRTRIVNDRQSLAMLAPEWRELVRRSAHGTPFQSPEWLISWVETFAPQSLSTIEVRYQNRLVGLAPLLIYPRQAEQVLAFMGGGVSDYLEVVLESGWEQEAWEEILVSVLTLPGWTTLELTDLAPHSWLLRSGFGDYAQGHDLTSALELPENRDEFWRRLSRHQRANLRNARSRLLNAGGATIERASQETLAEFLEDLFRLHTERWSLVDEPGMLATEAVRSFHLRAAPLLLERGSLRMDRLRLKERTLAVVYSLLGEDSVFCYLQGFDPGFAYYSPGTQLMLRLIEDAIAEGRRRLDFLRGHEGYKQHWGARSESTYRIRLSRSQLADRWQVNRPARSVPGLQEITDRP